MIWLYFVDISAICSGVCIPGTLDNEYPMIARIMFHKPAPNVVNSRNLGSFMRARPAGMEISWRTAGISLPKKVEVAPWSSKYFSAWRTFSSFIRHRWPKRERAKAYTTGRPNPFAKK